MNIFKTFSLIIATIAITGCSTSRKVSSTPINTRPQQTESKRILYPSGHDSQKDFYVEDKGGFNKDMSGIKPEYAHPRYDMTFSQLETEHVRVPGVIINPLPGGGVLTVSLDDMEREFCYPYKGEFLSDYGMRGRAMHTGVDIRVAPNDTIRAAFPGVVRMSKLYSSYGNIVVIRHYAGFETVYAHNSKNLVKAGDKVEAGTPISLGGRTGRATCVHLHFEVRAGGEHIDPKKLLDIKNQTLNRGTLTFEAGNGKITAYNSLEDRDAIMRTTEVKVETSTVSSPAASSLNEAVKDKPQSATSSSKAIYHTVKQGDTLYGLSIKYKTTVKKICELNGISEKSILRLNQKLRVK